MPFDNVEFPLGSASPPDRVSPPVRPPGWHHAIRGLAARLRRNLRPAAPEPLDVAVLRVLEEARGLIELREDWTRGTYESWRGERCAVGALRSAANFLDYASAGAAAQSLLTAVARRRGYTSIEAMNDRSRHDEILAAFDEALGAAGRFGGRT
jgi:hypothetical protein